MKKTIMIISAIVLMAGFTSSAIAQTSATANANAGARLVVPMSITKNADLDFGTINVLAGLGGTVTLPANSTTREFSAGVATSSVGDPASNAAYSVTGTANSTYALTLPSTIPVAKTDNGITGSMTISALTVHFNSADGDAVLKTSKLGTDGTDNFTLGGVLTIEANQVAGDYAGTFDVAVDYN